MIEFRISRPRFWRLLILASVFMTGCLCEEIEKGKHDEVLDQVRESCDCDFTIACAELVDGNLGVTFLDAEGDILIQLHEDAEEDTLRHELVHAVDFCQGFSERATRQRIIGTYLQTRHPGVLGAVEFETFRDLSGYLQAILAEVVAYRKFETEESEASHADAETLAELLGFQNGDRDDLFIRDGVNTASRFREALGARRSAALRDLLDSLGLVPGDLRPSSPEYPPFKALLIELADAFEVRNRACCQQIGALVDDL